MPRINKWKEPEWLQRLHTPNWLVLIIAIIFILRIPSFFEPYYYGDEMIYLNLGEAIRRGLVLYRDIHDNKPPLLYFIAGISGSLFWFRAILTGWMIATTILFWKLASSLFPSSTKKSENSWIVKTSVAAFALLTTLPLLEGQIANAELFMIGPTIAAFYILITNKLTPRNLIISGFLFSMSTLFKVPAAFDLLTILFFWFVAIKLRRQEITDLTRKTILIVIGFIIPVLISVVWYSLRGAFSEYFIAAFLQNLGYLSSWRGNEVHQSFLVKNGPLLLRGGVLITALTLLFFFKKKLSGPFIFVTSWLLFALFAATLSERPYPHYLIQVVPAVSFLIGILVAKQSKEQTLSLLPLGLLLLTILKFQFWYYPTFSYYKNFIEFSSGSISKEQYFKKFDTATSRNYQIASFLASSSTPKDSIFVWGDSPAIYALSKHLPPIKYVASYHIVDFSSQEETLALIAEKRPHFIVMLPNFQPYPLLQKYLVDNYLEIDDFEGAKIWKSISF